MLQVSKKPLIDVLVRFLRLGKTNGHASPLFCLGMFFAILVKERDPGELRTSEMSVASMDRLRKPQGHKGRREAHKASPKTANLPDRA